MWSSSTVRTISISVALYVWELNTEIKHEKQNCPAGSGQLGTRGQLCKKRWHSRGIQSYQFVWFFLGFWKRNQLRQNKGKTAHSSWLITHFLILRAGLWNHLSNNLQEHIVTGQDMLSWVVPKRTKELPPWYRVLTGRPWCSSASQRESNWQWWDKRCGRWQEAASTRSHPETPERCSKGLPRTVHPHCVQPQTNGSI